MQSKTLTVKELLKNLIFIFFPREAGGNFLKNLIELGTESKKIQQKETLKELLYLLKKTNKPYFHLEELTTSTSINTIDFLKKIKSKIEENKSPVFCDHYYTYESHKNFFKNFKIEKFIVITCYNSHELLNSRRKKHKTPVLSDEEIQLNNIFVKFLKEELKNAKIIEIEYKDLTNTELYLNFLEKINKVFDIDIPVNDCKELVDFYLKNKVLS